MISKNFDFVKDYYGFGDYYDDLSIIEDYLLKEDKYGIVIDSVKFLEKLLKDIMSLPNFNRPLGELINEFKRYYKYETNNILPSNIEASFKSINIVRISDVHHNDALDYGNVEASFTTKINILQSLRKILHFIIYSFNDSNIELNQFDDEIYYKIVRNGKNIEIKNTFSYENNQIMLEKISIGEFVLNDTNNFVIPSYQRDYRWSEVECQELLNQIIDKFETSQLIYFGTMACKITDEADETKSIRLIDGQQRVTTSLILFKVFNDLIKNKIIEENDDSLGNPVELEKLFEYKDLQTNKFSDERIRKKYLNYTSEDKSAQEAIYFILKAYILEEEFKNNLLKIGQNNIINNFNFFRKELSSFSIEKLLDLYNYYSNNFVISCIKFDEENSNEMEIFENLNSLGKELDAFDVIKNYLYNIVDESFFKLNPQAIINEFKKYFRLNDVIGLAGNLEKCSKIYEDFLFNFLRYKNALKNFYNGKIQKNKKSILKAFKSLYYKNKLNFEEYSSICSEIGRYFKIYKTIKLAKTYKNVASEFYEIREVLQNLQHKDLSILIFMLIDVYSDYSWNKEEHRINLNNITELHNCFFEIEKWVICLLQVKGTGQSLLESVLLKLVKFIRLSDDMPNIKKKLPSLLKEWLANKIPTSIENKGILIAPELQTPTRAEVLASFENSSVQDVNIKIVLTLRIENYLANLNSKKKNNFLNPKDEHIIPKILTKEWENMLSNNQTWTNDWSDKHKQTFGKLGNLLIIENSSINKSSNLLFNVKKDIYLKTNSEMAKLNFGSNNMNLLERQIFNFENINERTNKLALLIVDKIYTLD